MVKKKEKIHLAVDNNQELIRIDKFLFDKMPNVTRSKIQDGIKLGRVCVNGNKIKPSYKVKPNDEVIVEIYKEKRDDTNRHLFNFNFTRLRKNDGYFFRHSR